MSPYELLCAARQGSSASITAFHALVDHPGEIHSGPGRLGWKRGRPAGSWRAGSDRDSASLADASHSVFLEDIRRTGLDATLPVIHALGRSASRPGPLLGFYRETGEASNGHLISAGVAGDSRSANSGVLISVEGGSDRRRPLPGGVRRSSGHSAMLEAIDEWRVKVDGRSLRASIQEIEGPDAGRG